MRAVVVGVDVGGDLLSRLVEGLALGAPDELLFQLPEPAQPERRRFGAAVAATAMGDAVLGEAGAGGTSTSVHTVSRSGHKVATTLEPELTLY